MLSQKMRTILYGKKAANLYTQAFVQNTQARALYQESEDTYYRANDAASYDDWRRARHQWDYFYNRYVSISLCVFMFFSSMSWSCKIFCVMMTRRNFHV
jgi:hypothetical protein